MGYAPGIRNAQIERAQQKSLLYYAMHRSLFSLSFCGDSCAGFRSFERAHFARDPSLIL